MVLTFDILISVPMAAMTFQQFVLGNRPFREDELVWYIISAASWGNVLLDVILIYRIWQYPGTINRIVCWLKAITGFLGLLTIVSGAYFLTVSASMLNAPPVALVRRSAGPPGSMTLRDTVRYHCAEVAVALVFLAGIGIIILGFFIASGNRTGISPTFPFAGYLTSFAGLLVLAFGVRLERHWLPRLKW